MKTRGLLTETLKQHTHRDSGAIRPCSFPDAQAHRAEETQPKRNGEEDAGAQVRDVSEDGRSHRAVGRDIGAVVETRRRADAVEV